MSNEMGKGMSFTQKEMETLHDMLETHRQLLISERPIGHNPHEEVEPAASQITLINKVFQHVRLNGYYGK